MKTSKDDLWSAVPNDRIKITKWFTESLPVGTKGTIVGTGKRPNGVRYYNVKWDNGKDIPIYDALLYGHCVKV